jgi:two-component system, NarL family, response regulator NreC
MSRIRVLLVDDHRILLDGIKSLLAQESDIEVVGEASNGKMAYKLVAELHPDIVVMDIVMPEINGVEATKSVLATHPETRILCLSMHTDARFITHMLQAGASGFLPKESAFEELSQAIRVVHDGVTYLSPSIQNNISQVLISGATIPFASLSAREQDVLRLIAEGKSTKEIADTLYLSTKTIETHRAHIMHKLGVRSIAELTKIAITEGLVVM